MTILTPTQRGKAAKSFLASHPAVAARILSITQQDADLRESTLEKLRIDKTIDEIAKYAHENKKNPTEMLFSLAAEGWEDYAALQAKHEENINRSSL